MNMALPRISGRVNQAIDLDASFLRNGVLTDPYAIRQIDIYKTQVVPANLIASFPVVDPDDPLYPSPAVKTADGKYLLTWDVPASVSPPDIFFDVWSYFADNPCEVGSGGTYDFLGSGTEGACDLEADELQSQLLSCCHRFWIYPDGWFCGDMLQTFNFAFEPLGLKFKSPEKRFLEVGLQPLPLYDFNFNQIAPMVPFITATIRIETRNCELLVDDLPMEMALRQGSFRTNPFVLRYLVDTSNFLIGTYRYRILMNLPDGTTKASQWFILQVT